MNDTVLNRPVDTASAASEISVRQAVARRAVLACLRGLLHLFRRNTRAGDLRTLHLEDIGPHYAETLLHWSAKFLSQIEAVRAQSYPETFIRMCLFYLGYCEAGFRERDIGTVQMLLAKPDWRAALVLGQLKG